MQLHKPTLHDIQEQYKRLRGVDLTAVALRGLAYAFARYPDEMVLTILEEESAPMIALMQNTKGRENQQSLGSAILSLIDVAYASSLHPYHHMLEHYQTHLGVRLLEAGFGKHVAQQIIESHVVQQQSQIPLDFEKKLSEACLTIERHSNRALQGKGEQTLAVIDGEEVKADDLLAATKRFRRHFMNKDNLAYYGQMSLIDEHGSEMLAEAHGAMRERVEGMVQWWDTHRPHRHGRGNRPGEQ